MKTDFTLQRRANLKRLFNPQHIAFVGGRAVEDSIRVTQKSGFKGQMWVVHPTYESLGGTPCFPSLSELPEAPDATLIAISPERTIAVVKELAAMGAGGGVSIVGEFAEAGEQGRQLQQQLKEAAQSFALVGPNCLGVMNQFDGSAVWGGDNVFEPAAGEGVALISQSGYVAYSISNVEQALPLGYVISMGNQAVLNVADYIDAMLDDKRVRAIGLYLEGIVDISAFSASALRAVKQGVPLVAIKAGGTAETAELARSHSGTLAVDNEIWSALFRRFAIVEVDSPKAMIETLKLLGASKSPQGNRIVAAANSGGYATMIGEKGRTAGLAFPEPSREQRQALRQAVPDLVSLLNPLDWNLPWASMSTPDTSETGMGIMMDERCDLLIYFVDWPRQEEVAEVWWPTLEGLIQLNKTSDRPVIVASVLPDGLPADLRLRLAEGGVITLQGLDDAINAIGAAVQYVDLRSEVLSDIDSRLLVSPVNIGERLETLNESEGKALLVEYGVAVPDGVFGVEQYVIEQADELGFPLAIKLLNSDIDHKHRIGAVRLNVRDAGELREAIAAIKSSVADYDASLATNEFLIERMIETSRAEFIAGITHKPGIGHAMVVGHGGTAVEDLKDFVTLLLPVCATQIAKAINRLQISRKLKLSDQELTALVKTIYCIAELAVDHRDRLQELDVNPIILDSTGHVTAVDALVRMVN